MDSFVVALPVDAFVTTFLKNDVRPPEERVLYSSDTIWPWWPTNCTRFLEGLDLTTVCVSLSAMNEEAVMPNCGNHLQNKGDGEGRSEWE